MSIICSKTQLSDLARATSYSVVLFKALTTNIMVTSGVVNIQKALEITE